MYTEFAPLFAWLDYGRGGAWWPITAAILGALAVAGVVWLYVREAGRIPLPARIAMAATRVGIVLAVAFLMIRPVWVSDKQSDKLRPVVLLVDVSQSMDAVDPRPGNDDQARAALAYGLLPVGGLPTENVTSLVPREKLLPAEKAKRIEIAREALSNPRYDLLNRLKTVGPLEVYTFGDRRTGRDPGSDAWLKGLAATEPRTALVSAGFELLNRDDTDAPAALVVVTDGRENGGGGRGLDDLARECYRRNIPVHVYGVGATAVGQLQAAFGGASTTATGTTGVSRSEALEVPTTLFVGDVAAIPVRYTIKGVLSGTADITLRYGDREVATKKESFTLTPEEARAGKTFATVVRFVPTKEDAESKKQEYGAKIVVTAGGETLTSDISRPAQVVDRKLKVLVVDGLPRYDFKFLQRALLRDRRVEAKFYLTEGDKAAMRSGPPWMVEFSKEIDGVLNMDRDEFRKTLFDFDLLILGDVPGKYFTAVHQGLIEDFVKEGGGLIHVAGRWHGPAEWASPKGTPPKDQSPIAKILPVEFDTVRFPIQALDSPVGFVPVLAPGAARTQIVNLEDDAVDNAEIWGRPGPPPAVADPKTLKPLYWHYPVTRVKPAADVILTHPTARTPAPDDKPMPLLVGHYYGKGYALFVAFDDTWRWRFNTQEKYFGKFWTQAVYTAGIPRVVGTKQTQVASNTPAPVVGTAGEIYLRAFNPDFQPLGAEEVEGTLERLDAGPDDKDRSVPVTFRKVPGAAGEFVATLAYNKAGQFRLTVDPKNRSVAVLNFPVAYADTHELAPGPMDEPALRKLTRDSRGLDTDAGFYREETLHKLAAEVKPQSAPQTGRVEWLLWNEWAMGILIALLTLEWVLRKFNGMN